MSYKEVAQEICKKIVEVANGPNASANQIKKFGLLVDMDGATYEGIFIKPDTKFYSLASRPEDYEGDAEMYEEVQVDEMVFPCKGIKVVGNTLVFDCIDVCDIATQKCIAFGYVAEVVSKIDINTIRKVVATVAFKDKIVSAGIIGCDPCDFYNEPFTKGQKMLTLQVVELDDVLDLNGTPTINKLAEDQYDEHIQYSRDMKGLGNKFYKDDDIDECDAGGAGATGGGDAGAGASAGDAGGAVAADGGDAAAEMAGTTVSDVLGKCKPGEGYMGKGNFYIPARAKCPLHHWEAANGGSKRKKKGKYPYEKGMKVVVSMFEDEEINETGVDVAKIYFKEFSQPEIVNSISNIYQAIQWLDDWKNTAEPEGDFPEVVKIVINGKTYGKYDIEQARHELEDEHTEKYNRTHFFEDDDMLNEWETWTFDKLHGMTWDEVKQEAAQKSRGGKEVALPPYERWEAAQIEAPDEASHGKLGGCVIDEGQFGKRDYLKEYYIHGFYADGTLFELGPMKRKVASEYLSLHKLTVNSRAYQQMKDSNFSGIQTIGKIDGSPMNIGKLQDGFWLMPTSGSGKIGPFSNKQLARMYALANGLTLLKGKANDKADIGERLEYPTFSFSYTMAGIPCMDIVVAEDLSKAMKLFDFQWRVFDNTRPVKQVFNTIEDLKRDLSLLRIKDIEIEELNAGNVDEYVELAQATGNPSTIPSLKARCKNPRFRYILGRDGKTGRSLVRIEW